MQRFPILNLPHYALTLQEQDGKTKVFDALRKKWLVLSPEEWVRQHLIQYLIQEKKYPKGRIQLEGGLQVNTLSRRSDILIYDDQGAPYLLVECKASSVRITQEVFEQAAAYNSSLKVRYLVVSNGLQHFCCEIDYHKKESRYLADIPVYEI